MGRGKALTRFEIEQILELRKQNLTISKISKNVSKSQKVIYNLFKNGDNYGKRTGRPPSLSERDKCSILRVASNSSLTMRQIMQKAGVTARIYSVHRVVQSCNHLKKLKIKKKPVLTS